MANKWPEQRRLIGTKIPRVDGPAKSTGAAKYSYDINRKGMLHAVMLRSPHGHAKIKSLDTNAAEKLPGVKAIFAVGAADKEVFYAGEEILGIAADTEEHALDAARAVKIDFEVLPHFVNEDDALKNQDKPRTVPGGDKSNVVSGGQRSAGNVEEAFRAADAVVEATYGVPVITHVCLETHGLVAEWQEDASLTVWASTQATTGTAGELAQRFKIPATKVKCITHYMGGGYGSKFGSDIQGNVAAELAKKAGAAVKLMLDRADEHTAGGNRPSTAAKVKIAGTKEGKITAFQAETYGTPGIGRTAGVNQQIMPYVYDVPNVKWSNQIVRLNAGNARAMRAPGHPQACFITESAVEDLANKLGINPMDFRLKNLPQNDANAVQNSPLSYPALRRTIYEDEIKIARELSQWDNKWHPPGKGGNGLMKHGMGMAVHTWGGAGSPNNLVRVSISADGSVLVQSSTQDLGTGERTVLPIVVAEVLGLEVKDITSQIGESPFGSSSGSGGSTTCPGTAPPTLNAAIAARDDLFKKIADRLGAKPDNLTIERGKVVDKANKKEWSWKQACAKLGMESATGSDTSKFGSPLANISVGGVQIAEVLVDTETGVARCTKFVAVQDCGLVINKLGCESQVAGGVIMGINYALFEERIMDRHTGRQCNPDMEFYKLGGIQDMPEIIVHMHDMPERGVIGIGEPPTISTAAAIGNAICNAIGARVPFSPFTPARVLAALQQSALAQSKS